MEQAISQIKERIDIVEYINSRLPLKKTGRLFKACCPFHNEKSPSFVVSPDRQIWRCFGACQKGGDLITFVMEWEKVSFVESVKILAETLGIALDSSPEGDASLKKRDRLVRIHELASQYYHFLLTKHLVAKTARQYLSDRGINEKIITTFQLGYAPNNWDNLTKFLKKKGFSDNDLVDSGLMIKSQKSNSVYDRFRGRIMFPIRDQRGKTIAFSGRLLSKSEKESKYVNSPETELYQKRKTLFGLDIASKSIQEKGFVVLVEGEFDLLSHYQIDIKNVVAIKGSILTPDQLTTLSRLTKRLVLALDSDFAGSQAAIKAINEATNADFVVEVVRFDGGKDPDEAIKNDKKSYNLAFANPAHIYDFLIDYFEKLYLKSDDIYEKKLFVEAVIPFLDKISNPILQTYYFEILSEKSKVKLDDIKKLAKEQKRSSLYQPIRSLKTANLPTNELITSRLEKLMMRLLSLIISSQKFNERAKTILVEFEVESVLTRPLEKILGKLATSKIKNMADFAKSLDEELIKYFDYSYLDFEEILDEEVLDKEIKRTKKDIWLEYYRQQLLLLESGKADQARFDFIRSAIKSLEKS